MKSKHHSRPSQWIAIGLLTSFLPQSFLGSELGNWLRIGSVIQAAHAGEEKEQDQQKKAVCVGSMETARVVPNEGVKELTQAVSAATKSPAVQSIFSLERPWRMIGHLIPVLPLIGSFKDKDRRFFNFVESPFVTGIPSGVASVVLTKALFWGLSFAFLGSQKPFPALFNYDTLLKFTEVWFLYNGTQLFRGTVTTDPTIPDNKMEWWKSQKYWLNYYYSTVSYTVGTIFLKPALHSFFTWLHAVQPEVFPAPPAVTQLDAAHKLGETVNAAAWPTFSQYAATYFVVPIMFGRWPKKNLMDKISAVGTEPNSEETFDKMVAERTKKIEGLEKDHRKWSDLTTELKKMPVASRTNPKVWSDTARGLFDELQKAASEQYTARKQMREKAANYGGLRGAWSRGIQRLSPLKAQEVDFALVLKTAKFRAMNARNSIQETTSERRWILFLTRQGQTKKGSDIGLQRWAGMYLHKIGAGILMAMTMQTLYWGLRTVIAGDMATNTPTLLQRIERGTESTRAKIEAELSYLRDASIRADQRIDTILESRPSDPVSDAELEAQMAQEGADAVRHAQNILDLMPEAEKLSAKIEELELSKRPVEVDEKTALRLEAIQSLGKKTPATEDGGIE